MILTIKYDEHNIIDVLLDADLSNELLEFASSVDEKVLISNVVDVLQNSEVITDIRIERVLRRIRFTKTYDEALKLYLERYLLLHPRKIIATHTTNHKFERQGIVVFYESNSKALNYFKLKHSGLYQFMFVK